MVISLTTGDTLFARNAGMSLNPASTLKLYTTALAFEQLGPTIASRPTCFRQGVVSNGTLTGNLILRGGGDPALSRRYFDGDGNGPMRALARQVADAGIRRITGDVIGDDRAFEAKPVPDGWLQRYLHASYAARVSALSLNENLIHVVVTPGRAGQPGTVRLEPATTAFTRHQFSQHARQEPRRAGHGDWWRRWRDSRQRLDRRHLGTARLRTRRAGAGALHYRRILTRAA